jgi:hypothetical protein
VSLSRLTHFELVVRVDIVQEETAEDVARFRFNERWSPGVDGGKKHSCGLGSKRGASRSSV